jgi:hypothetical protein
MCGLFVQDCSEHWIPGCEFINVKLVRLPRMPPPSPTGIRLMRKPVAESQSEAKLDYGGTAQKSLTKMSGVY